MQDTGSELNHLLCGSAAGLAWHLGLWLLCLSQVNISPYAQWPHSGSQPSLTLTLCTWFLSTTTCFTESPREELQMHLRYPSFINGAFLWKSLLQSLSQEQVWSLFSLCSDITTWDRLPQADFNTILYWFSLLPAVLINSPQTLEAIDQLFSGSRSLMVVATWN